MGEAVAAGESMRAVLLDRPGGPDALRVDRIGRPRPGAGEVLIRVEAAGVNRPDLMQRAGRYPPPPDASPLLGLEVAGEVVALGEGAEAAGAAVARGARVTALVNGGGYAEYCVAPAGQCLPWPEGFDAIRAAALPENLFTVWCNVFAPRDAGGAALAAGERFLVHGGSSGIGLTAIQLARRLRGATVFTTAGSAAKCDAARAAGATHAIDYRERDFAEAVMAETGGEGIDAILDMVGGDYVPRGLSCLREGGRLVLIATQQGRYAERVDLVRIMQKRLVLTGSTLRPRSRDQKAAIAAALRSEVWPLLDRGEVAPVIEATFPLEQAAAAHALMEGGTHVGKIVLTVGAAA